jgi:uncharacterized protein YbcI
MEKELSKAISHLKSNKSPGLDNINNNMIKYSQTVLLKSLQKKLISALSKFLGKWIHNSNT